MKKKEINVNLIVVLLLVGWGLWNIQPSAGLDIKAWHIFVVFLVTILGIITSVMPMGAVTLVSIITLVLTETISLKEGLSGFSSPIAWLVLAAFFMAKGFIKTNLGKRIAYILISKFGETNIGLSYSLIFTEFLLSPLIPSTSARGGGIIYPIASSIAARYDSENRSDNNNAKFIISTAFHTNVVCCALFLTAMSGNLLIQSLAQSLGVTITWAQWALAAIVPGLLNLVLLPYVTSFLIKPHSRSNSLIIENAKNALKESGRLSQDEKIMLGTFAVLLFLWTFGGYYKIDATTAAFIGLIILVVTKVLSWKEITAESTGWETFIWFSILLMLSDCLAKYGIDKWLEGNIRLIAAGINPFVAISSLIVFYFFSHYLFASITARVTVMYATFLLILIDIGAPPLTAAIGLAILSNLSAGLTHYGINSASIYFSSGYFTIPEWWKIGVIVASFNFLLWLIVGGIWWRIIGLW